MDATFRQLHHTLRIVQAHARTWIHDGTSPEALLVVLRHVYHLMTIGQLPHALLLLDHLLITHTARSRAGAHSATAQKAA